MIATALVLAASTELAPPEPPATPPAPPRSAAAPELPPAADPPTHTRADGEVFTLFRATYTHHPTDGAPWFARFDVPRARVGGLVGEDLRPPAEADAPLPGPRTAATDRGRFRVRLLAEAVRSTADGGLLGAAGDSLLVRVREGYGGWSPHRSVEVRAGVVPLPVVEAIDEGSGLRVLGPSGVEGASLLDAADLGASCTYYLPKGLGRVDVVAVNGEGYTRREQNRAKNLEAAIVLRPAGALRILAAVRKGTRGTLDVRADRATVGGLWITPQLRAGIVATGARGVDLDGTAKGWALEAFARAEPRGPWIFAGRVQVNELDTRVVRQTVLGQVSVGAHVFRGPPAQAEAHLVGELATASAAVFAQNPATRNLAALAAVRVHF